MRVLICGHRAYAARNFESKLKERRHTTFCFSRGDIGKKENVVTGPVAEIDNNPFLKGEDIDAVVNFIILDGKSVDDNLAYIQSLCRFCETNHVKRLIHMSSISALPNNADMITEDTPDDNHPEFKGAYGALKIAIDNYLLDWTKNQETTKLILFRPGFITATDKKNALAGIAKMLPGNIAILMGNRESTLPIIQRDALQKGLINAIETTAPLDVYLMVERGNHTKEEYLHSINPKAKVVPLPKWLVLMTARLLKAIRIFDERKLQMVTGQFKVQRFDATKTYKKIQDTQ